MNSSEANKAGGAFGAESVLSSLLEASPVGVVILDRDARVVGWNPAAEQIFGWSASETVGKPFPGVTDEQRPDFDANLQSVLRGEAIPPRHVRRTRRDGMTIDLAIALTPVRAQGAVTGVMAMINDLTESRRKEAALRQSEERFRMLTEHSSDLVHVQDGEGRILYVTPSAQRILGASPDQMTGALIWAYMHPEDQARVRRVLAEQLLRPFASANLEYRLRHGSGAWRTMYATAKNTAGADAETTVTIYSRDVTEARLAQDALEESEQRFRSLSEASFEAILLHELGRILIANRAAADMFGYQLTDLSGMDGMQLVSPECRALVRARIASGYQEPYESLGLRSDGTSFPIEIRGRQVPYQGRIVRVVGIRDLTERKRAEEALHKSEARYRSLVDTVREVIFQTDADGRWTFLNPAWKDLTGFGVEDSLGTSFLDYVHPDDRERSLEAFLPLVRQEQEVSRREVRYVRKDGGRRWVEVHARLLLDSEGAPIGTTGTLDDITARVEAQQSAERLIREQAARAAAEAANHRLEFLARVSELFSSSLDYTTTLQHVARTIVPDLADWCIVYLKGEGGQVRRLELAHTDREKVAALNELTTRFPPDYQSSEHPVGRTLRTGESQLVPEIPDGLLEQVTHGEEHLQLLKRLGFHSFLLVPLTVRGEILGALALVLAESTRSYTAEDLAFTQEIARRASVAIENSRLFSEAVEANRVKADFLATISHELRTPLNAMIGYTDLLVSGIPAEIPDQAKAQVKRIGLSARHLLQLIEEILTFSRFEAGRESVSISNVPLSELIDESTAIVEPLTEERGLGFIVERSVANRTLRTDPRKVRQVLLNLIGNAIKFTNEGQIAFRIHGDGNWTIFEVSDTGIGIDQEHLEKIFEPFWQAQSEKSARVGGTGLGLSVTRQLVHLLGGEITVTSEVGVGTTFLVRLPNQLPG